jgi:hypothetical protein
MLKPSWNVVLGAGVWGTLWKSRSPPRAKLVHNHLLIHGRCHVVLQEREALLHQDLSSCCPFQGLSLFNFDMIREGGAGHCYYVIDINYFPGMWFWVPHLNFCPFLPVIYEHVFLLILEESRYWQCIELRWILLSLFLCNFNIICSCFRLWQVARLWVADHWLSSWLGKEQGQEAWTGRIWSWFWRTS